MISQRIDRLGIVDCGIVSRYDCREEIRSLLQRTCGTHVSAHTAAVQFHLRLRMLSRARKDVGLMNHSPFGTARDTNTTRQADTYLRWVHSPTSSWYRIPTLCDINNSCLSKMDPAAVSIPVVYLGMSRQSLTYTSIFSPLLRFQTLAFVASFLDHGLSDLGIQSRRKAAIC
jgi:hypothetical protein